MDSFGLEGKINETGGIYSIAAPTLNMCYPPLRWQTYDIWFRQPRWEDGKQKESARITVVQNGLTAHDDVVLTLGAGSIGAAARRLPSAMAVKGPVGVKR